MTFKENWTPISAAVRDALNTKRKENVNRCNCNTLFTECPLFTIKLLVTDWLWDYLFVLSVFEIFSRPTHLII